MLKTIASLFRKKERSVFPHKTYPLMAKGFPPPDLVWKTAFELWEQHMTPMCIEDLPTSCPECGATMTQGQHDWMDIEDSGQYMVHSATCPKGHGYAVDVA